MNARRGVVVPSPELEPKDVRSPAPNPRRGRSRDPVGREWNEAAVARCLAW